jgi:hypothetical protein
MKIFAYGGSVSDKVNPGTYSGLRVDGVQLSSKAVLGGRTRIPSVPHMPANRCKSLSGQRSLTPYSIGNRHNMLFDVNPSS